MQTLGNLWKRDYNKIEGEMGPLWDTFWVLCSPALDGQGRDKMAQGMAGEHLARRAAFTI